MKNNVLTPDTRFLIVGLGLIGGCYAQGLSQQGYEVAAIDPNPESLSFALDKGWIKEGYQAPDEHLSSYDIVILCLYPSLVSDWIRDNKPLLQKGAIITDAAGIKGLFVNEVQELLGKDAEFIGAHPMAGREVSGVQNADVKIFHNANYIVTPTSKNTQKAIEIAKEIGELLGFSTISMLTPEEHDRMISYLSQLTHVIAMALMVCEDNESYARYSGDSFRDLTRIAKINDALWSELFLSNKGPLLESIDLFMKQMEEVKKQIQEGNVDALREDMRLAKKRRLLFEKPKKNED